MENLAEAQTKARDKFCERAFNKHSLPQAIKDAMAGAKTKGAARRILKEHLQGVSPKKKQEATTSQPPAEAPQALPT